MEASFYTTLAFPEIYRRWSPALLVAAAPLPYLIYTVPADLASWTSLAAITALAATAAYWFRILPRNRVSDFGFIALMAAPLIFRLFRVFYPELPPELKLDILGHLMWIRIGALSVLRDRPEPGVGFGFLPNKREWSIGAIFYLICVPVAAGVITAGGMMKFVTPTASVWTVAGSMIGTFLGILWVVALSEEFFFRGLLLQWLDDITSNQWVSLILTSLLFGAVHLGYRGFPNWEFAGTAAVAGIFYGIAFRKGHGIRAAMVTHALLVTTWRTFYRFS